MSKVKQDYCPLTREVAGAVKQQPQFSTAERIAVLGALEMFFDAFEESPDIRHEFREQYGMRAYAVVMENVGFRDKS